MEIFSTVIPFIIPAIIVIAVVVILASGYLKAPPDVAYVISGLRKKPRILVGQAGIKIPFFERVDKLALGAIQIDVKTSSSVPTAEYINVRVDSNVNVKVGHSDEMIKLACQNFLNMPRDEINRKVRDLLEGNVREIIGQMKLTDMVSDRKAFSEKVQENAVPDLARFGLELVSFNVQNYCSLKIILIVTVIDNLGIDNVEQIRKKAAIAKSDAQREIAIAEAENAKTSNDAKVKAAEEIAARNNDLAIKQAQLQREADTQKAQAEAAKSIETENQKRLKNIAATNAEIAKAEREAELKQKEVELKEYELTALVRKQADAEKYAAEKAAEADLIRRQKEAEAKRYEQEQKAAADKYAAEQNAEAMRVKADAEKYAAMAQAEGIAAVGKADAEAIQAKALAEAEGINRKAEAQQKMGEASVLEMYFDMLPQAVANAAAPLTKVDKIVQYGDGNSTKMIQDIMGITTQVMESMNESGIDIKSLLAGYVGGKMASN